jgi:hypothetical protein
MHNDPEPAPNTVTKPIHNDLEPAPNVVTKPETLCQSLAQWNIPFGTRMPDGTNTIFFIAKEQVDKDHRPTFGHLVVSIQPQKKETHCTQLLP